MNELELAIADAVTKGYKRGDYKLFLAQDCGELDVRIEMAAGHYVVFMLGGCWELNRVLREIAINGKYVPPKFVSPKSPGVIL